MLRSIKSTLQLTLSAAAVAAGSLAAGSAQAQAGGWNIIRPTSCYVYDGPLVNGLRTSVIDVYTSTFTVTLHDPGSVAAAATLCNTGQAFWSYNTGGNNWSWVYIVPGLK